MTSGPQEELSPAAERLLLALAAPQRRGRAGSPMPIDRKVLEALVHADLVAAAADRPLTITAAGRAHLARRRIANDASEIDPFLGQHLELARRQAEAPLGRAEVTINDAESPLVWLARRKDRHGRPLIESVQLQAGERLRRQFTQAGLSPRVTSNWTAAIAQGRRSAGGSAAVVDTIVTAKQQVRQALATVGPEFAGLLVDVCCFLKGLEDVERERGWPRRSGKVVLQLGLDRLARHYGLTVEARGRSRTPLRAWHAPEATFASERN